MARGNPNPKTDHLTPFVKGKSGNPGGKTREQRLAEIAAGERAAIIQAKMLEALEKEVVADPARALEAIQADPLRLIKDAMDRAFGTAVNRNDHTSSDNTMTPAQPIDKALSDALAKKLTE